MSLSDPYTERIQEYADPGNPDRFVAFAEDLLGLTLAATQRRILRAIAEHQYIHIQSGNGVGKTFAVGVANLAYLFTHTEAICYTTSGTYGTLEDTLWKPMRDIYRESRLPGVDKESPPRIEDLPSSGTSYFKARSPKYAGSLEGRHGANMLVSVEEADKPDIDHETITSMETNVTDRNDRMVVIGNPPNDQTGVMGTLSKSEKYHTIQFSSFESHNVTNRLEEDAEGYIPGLVAPSKVRERWHDWNDRDWPGLEAARTAHNGDTTLDSRWYKRVLGLVPPAGAAAWRPVDLPAVKAAFDRPVGEAPSHPDAVAIDVARKIDRTVMAGVHGLEASGYDPEIRIHYADQGKDHTKQEADLRTILDEWHPRGVPIAIDHMGSGEGLGDRLNMAYPDVHFFQNGGIAANETQYYDCWTEGLDMLGTFLADGGAFANTYLREELVATSRTITLSERHLASRGEDGADVIDSDSKDNIKDAIGRSPDFLDASLMAVWRATADPDSGEDSFLISY